MQTHRGEFTFSRSDSYWANGVNKSLKLASSTTTFPLRCLDLQKPVWLSQDASKSLSLAMMAQSQHQKSP